ncbi:MAG: hypothetical protein AB201_02925 [Parcubacteria bacterium C7867-006]|nr:MAG: hypothetical protein AB201_02925 [Parcubacteria bacterium C7867-006]
MDKTKIKYAVYAIWFLMIGVSLYYYFFAGSVIRTEFSRIFGSSLVLGYFVYLLAGCLRGFTLIPITYLIVVGILFLPPLPLYFLTMIGVFVSSLSIYYFSEYLNFDEYFEKKHPKQIQSIKNFLVKNELPIVVGWSFAPFLPTDLICYVCGAMEINVKKFIFGVIVGEGISCAIYIFLGKEIIGFLF